jgi:hypothetical protein
VRRKSKVDESAFLRNGDYWTARGEEGIIALPTAAQDGACATPSSTYSLGLLDLSSPIHV